MRNILITGGEGQLASALRYHPESHAFHISAPTRTEMDITNVSSLERTIMQHAPDIIINTAAYTAVDQAEKETEYALQVNHIGAKNLALLCEQQNIFLLHLSTDYVFDGQHATPYQEEDEPNPINHYGMSKWLGEKAIRMHNQSHLILRISGLFSPYKNNFLKTMLRLAHEKKELRIVADQMTCPTSAMDIASTIFNLIQQKQAKGTYHYCSEPPVSWYQFAVTVIEEARSYEPLLIKTIQPITTAEYPTLAKRPLYSALDCSKIKKDFDINQPSWENASKQIVAQHYGK